MKHEGEILKRKLKEKKISAIQAAEKLGIQRASIYDFYKTKTFSNETKQKFKSQLGVNLFIELSESVDEEIEYLRKENARLNTELEKSRKQIEQMKKAAKDMLGEQE